MNVAVGKLWKIGIHSKRILESSINFLINRLNVCLMVRCTRQCPLHCNRRVCKPTRSNNRIPSVPSNERGEDEQQELDQSTSMGGTHEEIDPENRAPTPGPSHTTENIDERGEDEQQEFDQSTSMGGTHEEINPENRAPTPDTTENESNTSADLDHSLNDAVRTPPHSGNSGYMNGNVTPLRSPRITGTVSVFPIKLLYLIYSHFYRT